MKTASAACSRSCLMLPDIKQMLHCQADNRYAEPADKTEQDRFAAGTDQLDHIAVQTDCSHCHDDKELTQFL